MEAMEALQTLSTHKTNFFVNDYNEEMCDMIYQAWGVTNNNSPKPPNDNVSRPETSLNRLSVVVWGESGCGKTTLAMTLLPNALIVTHMDDLMRYNDKFDGIIFDDMSFLHTPREAQIHIVDNAIPRSIHCRYNVARIPAGVKKIFTTNNYNGGIFLDDVAIQRRISIIKFI